MSYAIMRKDASITIAEFSEDGGMIRYVIGIMSKKMKAVQQQNRMVSDNGL